MSIQVNKVPLTSLTANVPSHVSVKVPVGVAILVSKPANVKLAKTVESLTTIC